MNVVFVSPHLDDAVMSAGGTLGALVAGGAEALVCTVFAGSAEDAISPVAASFHADCGLGADGGARRREEDRAALAMLGADLVHLDFLDAIYRRTPEGWLCRSERSVFATDLPAEPGLSDAVTLALHELIDRTRPDEVVIPAGIGGHVDHLLVRRAAATACRTRHIRPLVWEDLPYGFDLPRPPGRARRWDGVGAIDLSGKLTAIARYASQIRMLWPYGEDWRAAFTAHALGRGGTGEVIWRLT